MAKSQRLIYLDSKVIRGEGLPENAILIGTNKAFTYKTKTGKKKNIYEFFYISNMNSTDQNPFNLIKFWREAFSLPVRTTPEIAPSDENQLALSLIEEEFNELKSAKTLNEIADAVGDLFFVVSQAAYIAGLKPEELIQKVYDSNMTKLCYSMIEVDKTIDFYKSKGVDAYYLKGVRDGEFIVKRLSDNKVLKSINFVEPKWDY